MTEKTANYTAEMEQQMMAVYDPKATPEERGEQVAALAEEFGKSPRSITAKLSRMGVYVKKTYATKQGGKPESKGEIVAGIADALGVQVEAAESLEKANKSILLALRSRLTK